MLNNLLNKLWAFVWKKWIPKHATVLKVKGWRTARIRHQYGKIETMSPCFWWFD